MSDDGSITAAEELYGSAMRAIKRDEPFIDLTPIIGVNASIVAGDLFGAPDAAFYLARLIDPTTRPAADGTCERCGAPAEALRDAYCAHCGRRIVRDEEDGR